jgi:ATP-dependent DNA helicase DinG
VQPFDVAAQIGRMAARQATVFCSATLAAPDMAHFMTQAGLPQALQMQAASPFDYANNALHYLPSGTAPAPSAQGWLAWAIDEMRQLVLASRGGAFLLFTSYNAMNTAVAQLGRIFTARGLTVLVQGEMPKLETARRFRSDGNAVLFATKSFFEGVSIDGAALRLVVVDKMPFEAPTPLTQAMEADLLDKGRAVGMAGKTLEMYPFNALRVPRMIIELKQALGRLIRVHFQRLARHARRSPLVEQVGLHCLRQRRGRLEWHLIDDDQAQRRTVDAHALEKALGRKEHGIAIAAKAAG